MPFLIHDHHIIPALAFIVLFAIWSNVLYFYSHGGGSHHHIIEMQQKDDSILLPKDLLLEPQKQQKEELLVVQEEVQAVAAVRPSPSSSIQYGQGRSGSDGIIGKEEDPPTPGVVVVNNHANKNISSYNYRSETNVFRQVLKRSQHFQYQCQTSLLPHHLGQVQPKDFDTGVPPLPEYGIQKALLQWLEKEQQQQQQEKGQDRDYPTCQLPPSRECNVQQFTIILMSHTVSDDERLSKLHRGIQTLSSWDITGEIILVWNNLHHVLEEEHCPKRQCRDLLSWDQDPHHKLRIFYALEQDGVTLENNLLNRYHPTIQPKHEAVVYFDDDGPFHTRLAMEVGFELWKRNSDVQIGSMARNIRFPSKRMNDLQNVASDLAAKLYMDGDWRLGVHPYDGEEIKLWEDHIEKEIEDEEKEEGQYQSHGYPEFTPICQKETGDVVEYNYFVFPNFKAHMSLPSGSILHRDFLCFVWHPAFEELREYILKHPTHPDDMTISTLVSHLTGKALRTFPKTVKSGRNVAGRRLLETGLRRNSMVEDERWDEHDHEKEEKSVEENEFRNEKVDINYPRRRLLWQQKDWGNMREEAIGSIVGYFGSINPGSVGWCAGTEYQEKAEGRGNMRYNCFNERPPDVSQIPWMNEGGFGHDEC